MELARAIPLFLVTTVVILTPLSAQIANPNRHLTTDNGLPQNRDWCCHNADGTSGYD